MKTLYQRVKAQYSEHINDPLNPDQVENYDAWCLGRKIDGIVESFLVKGYLSGKRIECLRSLRGQCDAVDQELPQEERRYVEGASRLADLVLEALS